MGTGFSHGSRAQVLLLEDEMLVAMIVEDTLQEAGYDVIGPVANTGKALSLLSSDDSQAFDAAVIDLNLGGHSALPVADMLAERGIPFLVVTGYGSSPLPRPHQNVKVLAKPFLPSELTRALEVLLNAPRSTPLVSF